MGFVDFRNAQKPICTSVPFLDDFEGGLKDYRALAKRCVEEFNENLLGKLCCRHTDCTTECLGRPIPKYTELEKFILNTPNVSHGIYKGKEVWLVKATMCRDCPFHNICTKTCDTVEDFLNKDTDLDNPVPKLTDYFKDLE